MFAVQTVRIDYAPHILGLRVNQWAAILAFAAAGLPVPHRARGPGRAPALAAAAGSGAEPGADPGRSKQPGARRTPQLVRAIRPRLVLHGCPRPSYAGRHAERTPARRNRRGHRPPRNTGRGVRPAAPHRTRMGRQPGQSRADGGGGAGPAGPGRRDTWLDRRLCRPPGGDAGTGRPGDRRQLARGTRRPGGRLDGVPDAPGRGTALARRAGHLVAAAAARHRRRGYARRDQDRPRRPHPAGRGREPGRPGRAGPRAGLLGGQVPAPWPGGGRPGRPARAGTRAGRGPAPGRAGRAHGLRIAGLAGLDGWTPSVTALRPAREPDEVPGRLAEIITAATLRYLRYGHGSPVLLVHTATAPNAVLHTLPALPARAMESRA